MNFETKIIKIGKGSPLNLTFHILNLNYQCMILLVHVLGELQHFILNNQKH